jgi:hypothetical protein
MPNNIHETGAGEHPGAEAPGATEPIDKAACLDALQVVQAEANNDRLLDEEEKREMAAIDELIELERRAMEEVDAVAADAKWELSRRAQLTAEIEARTQLKRVAFRRRYLNREAAAG